MNNSEYSSQLFYCYHYIYPNVSPLLICEIYVTYILPMNNGDTLGYNDNNNDGI